MRRSSGTRIPDLVRRRVAARDGGCVGPRLTPPMPGECFGAIEQDHIRASGGTGMKSASTDSNLCQLCSFHHRMKTEHGKTWRPVLIRWVKQFEWADHEIGGEA